MTNDLLQHISLFQKNEFVTTYQTYLRRRKEGSSVLVKHRRGAIKEDRSAPKTNMIYINSLSWSSTAVVPSRRTDLGYSVRQSIGPPLTMHISIHHCIH